MNASEFDSRNNLEIFFNFYKEMFSATDYKTFSKFFSNNNINSSKEYFKKSCGWSCRLGLNDSWEKSFIKSKQYDLYMLQQNYKVVGYRLEVSPNGFLIFLRIESFFGSISEEGYKMISADNGSLAIDRTIYLSEPETVYHPVNLIMHDESILLCLLLVDRESVEKIKLQKNCINQKK